MTDRDRSKDRVPSGQGGGSGYFLGLFGGSSRRTTPSARSAQASKTKTVGKRESLEELRSPKAVSPQILPPAGDSNGTAVASFDIQAASDLLKPVQDVDEDTLVDVINSTAHWILFCYQQPEDSTESAMPMDSKMVTTMYNRMIPLAQGKTNTPLRIASIRLLAALILAYPISSAETKEATEARPALDVRSLYSTLTESSKEYAKTSRAEVISVVVVALKALSKDGAELEGMDGITQWLVQSLRDLKDEWRAWCAQEARLPVQEWAADQARTRSLGSVRPSSPADAASGIFSLLASITGKHPDLSTRSDVDNIVPSTLSFMVIGIEASSHHSDPKTAAVSRAVSLRQSPAASTVNSPLGSAFGNEASLRRSGTLIRGRVDPQRSVHNVQNSPPSRSHGRQVSSPSITGMTSPLSNPLSRIRSPSPHVLNEEARWAQVIPQLSDLLVAVMSGSSTSDKVFAETLGFICLCFGQDEDDFIVPETVWSELSDIVHAMLSKKRRLRGEQIIRQHLEGKISLVIEDAKDQSIQTQRKVVRGAVIASRFLISRLSHPSSTTSPMLSLASMVPSLRAAVSVDRFPEDEQASDRSKWLPVDLEILALVQDYLFAMENVSAFDDVRSTPSVDTWQEGEAALDLLQEMLPIVLDPRARTTPSQPRASDSVAPHPLAHFAAIFDAVVYNLPNAIGRLQASTSNAPALYHPRYIGMLLKLAPQLDEDHAAIVIDYYRQGSLCLPFTPKWLEHIGELLEAFYSSSTTLSKARQDVATYIFRDVYDYAREISEYRTAFMEEIILPFLHKALERYQTDDLFESALATLVDFVVAETADLDAETHSVDAEASSESEGVAKSFNDQYEAAKAKAARGSFGSIRSIIIRLATQTPCKNEVPARASASADGPSHTVSPPSGAQSMHSHSPTEATPSESPISEKRGSAASSKGKEGSGVSALRGIMDVLSPPSRSRDLTPSTSSIASPVTEIDQPTLDASLITLPAQPTQTAAVESAKPHSDCKSILAVKALVNIFLQLAFASGLYKKQKTASRPTVTSIRCIAVYRDLLDLLFPMTDADQGAKSQLKLPARCPRARVSILQSLARLRADSDHQIYLRTDLDQGALPYATILKRTKETEAEKRAELEESSRKAAARASRMEGAEERGRAGRTSEPSNRSRSRSSQPLAKGADAAYHPLWRLPDHVDIRLPDDLPRSRGILTYEPTHPILKQLSPSQIHGIWLPVSEYLHALNGILRGHDWELVSYILTFLPLQLSNKPFFHGSKATKEIQALLDVLCNGVTGNGAPWERRFIVPSFIKRVDINAAAYQSLSVLVAYRGVLNRADCDRLVQAFISGLQGKGDVAKPCLQAITLAVFELEQSVSRHLVEIVRAMISILTTTGLAVHILEFLISLGQNGAIFRNFTDEQYRLIFRVAITYIGEHNARSDQAVDLKDPSIREAFILSQHVIGLAYYSIYIWFMALRLPQRDDLIPEIARELLKARSQRVAVDEMAEVCFDWLARYTYGNADPKPESSFLSDVVMSDNMEEAGTKSRSWLLGGSIVTVRSLPRVGWATITSTRATGATSFVGKLENVPHLDVGEANADLVSLPAVLMANRDPGKQINLEPVDEDEVAKPAEPRKDSQGIIPDPNDLVKAAPAVSDPQDFNQGSQHGYIWSGATPSQRRKDVLIEPSYIALQLLSSYPNASLDAPRGRLIPNEDRFSRTLRGIANTPVIDTLKIAVLYVGRNQTTEREILGNIDGSLIYLDFLGGLGRLLRLKGQVDVFVGGLNRDNDSDGEYAYAWWDDLSQMIFHTSTMMRNLPEYPNFENKKRLIGNDYVKIVYNNSGKEFAFDTIQTAWNFINIVITPHLTGPGEDNLPMGTAKTGYRDPDSGPWAGQGLPKAGEAWQDWDRTDWFKVTLQRAPGIPDFSPIGTHKLVSKDALPILVRHVAHLANDMAARFVHIRAAEDAASAEYITSWRSRLRAMARLEQMLPPIEVPPEDDQEAREQMKRDFTRVFSDRPSTSTQTQNQAQNQS